MSSEEIPGEDLEEIEKPSIGVLFTKEEARAFRCELNALYLLAKAHGDINVDLNKLFIETAKVIQTLTAGLESPLAEDKEVDPDE
jgi:hypothetical protein